MGWAAAMGCGAPPASPPADVRGSGPTRSQSDWDGTWVLGGGVRLSALQVEPAVPCPGETIHVAFTMEGPPLDLRLAFWPPATLGRQVAVGGVDAPDPRRSPDERVGFVDVEAASGRVTASWVLPEPWHAGTVALTVAARPRGDAPRVAVTEGPRTHDDLAVLALLEVEPMPTRSRAPRIDLHERWRPDGHLTEPWWDELQPMALVELPEGDPAPPRFASDVRIGWTGEDLLIGARMLDPDVWSTATARDRPLWEEEVFEVFVFGSAESGRYLELQVSPRGAVFDARFEKHRQGDVAWNSAFRSAAAVDGTIDAKRDRDRGWSVELAIPWDEICSQTDASCPPRPGMQLRLNIFRFERPRPGPVTALALSPPRVPDFHASTHAALVELSP